MKLTWAIFSLFALTTAAQQNTLRGRVVDAQTQQPLAYVSVFVSNTTYGTLTDSTGAFYFKNLPVGTFTVVASLVGFRPGSTEIKQTAGSVLGFLTIALTEDATQIDEVTVKAKRDKSWENDLKAFKSIFFGNSDNTRQCVIKNAHWLSFERKKDQLTAQASQPLLLENRALGYAVAFILKKFEASATDYVIAGDALFEELQPANLAEKNNWKANRLEAYRGSLNHFLQALARRTATEDGFVVYAYKLRGNDKKLTNNFSHNINLANLCERVWPDSLLKTYDGGFGLDLSRKLEVHFVAKEAKDSPYMDITHEVSQLESAVPWSFFNAKGLFLNQYQVKAVGAFSQRRMADLLPLDFQPSVEELMAVKQNLTNESNYYNNLQEKVLIQASKSSYYAGETLWFKTYQVYKQPVYRDAISRVVYVDLFNQKAQLLDTKVLKINSGVAWGDFVLPDSLKPGVYYLRAYTNWMRNFGDTTQTVLTVAVLDKGQVVDSEGDTTLITNQEIDVRISPRVVQKSARVRIDLLALPQQSYSVVVTNQNGVKYYPPLPTVFFAQHTAWLPSPPPFLPETGLSFVGKVRDQRGKPTAANLMLMRQDTFLVNNYQTDRQGQFWIDDLSANDTLQLDLLATNEKGKPLAVIELARRPAPAFGLPQPAHFPQIANQTTSLFTYDISPTVARTLQLSEVRVTAKRTDTTQIMRMHKIFGKPSYQFTQKEIEYRGQRHFIMAIQGRVAGLEVFFDAATGQIRFRSAKHGDWQPVIWLDGIRYNDINEINYLTNDQIARIDVYRTNSAMIVPGRSAGLIAIYTKTFVAGDEHTYENIPNAEGLKRFKFSGFYTPKKFYVPDYQKDKEKWPLFQNRSTLYWQPHLPTNETGNASVSFEAIGQAGFYRVEVVGYNAKGEVVKTTQRFEIR